MPDNSNRFNKLLPLALFAVVFLIGLTNLWETDAWWHLKSGEVITRKQELPANDVFSHTLADQPWVNDEWLGEVYLFGIYKHYGAAGLVVLSAFIGACIFFLALGVCKFRGVNIALAAPLLALAAASARLRISPRPDIFALLFLSIDLYIINKFLFSKNDDRRARTFLFLIPFIQVLWVNAHPSGLIGPGILLLVILCCIFSFVANGIPKLRFLSTTLPVDSYKMKLLGIVFVSSVMASLLNPYYSHSLTAAFEFSSHRVFMDRIVEWIPIPDLLAPYADIQTNCFRILFVLGAIGVVARIFRLNILDVALFAGTSFMAIKHQRFMATFAVAATPGIAFHLSGMFRAIKPIARFGGAPRMAFAARVVSLIFLCGFCYFMVRHDPRFALGVSVVQRRFPEHAVEFIKKNHIAGNMYNEYAFGGYILWALYPDNKVFIDGRTTFYGELFYKQYLALEDKPSSSMWREIENKYGLDYAILSLKQRTLRDAIMASSPDWRLVFWDNISMVLVKDIPKFAGVIRDNAYTYTEPYNVMNFPSNWSKTSTYVRDAVIKELIRNVRQSPDCKLANRALADIYTREKKFDLAEKYARQGLEYFSDESIFHALLGRIALGRGNRAAALEHYRAAAEFNSNYEPTVKKLEE